MTATSHPVFSDILRTPRISASFGFFGLMAGWRAWQTFEALDALTDAELAARGLTRADLPRAALAAMRRG